MHDTDHVQLRQEAFLNFVRRDQEQAPLPADKSQNSVLLVDTALHSNRTQNRSPAIPSKPTQKSQIEVGFAFNPNPNKADLL
jgi:hypothetical protein